MPEPGLPIDAVESWEIFTMATWREQRKDEGRTLELFHVRWEFVNTYLTHCAVEDPALVLRDLIELQRALSD